MAKTTTKTMMHRAAAAGLLLSILVCVSVTDAHPRRKNGNPNDMTSDFMSARILGESGKITLFKGADTSGDEVVRIEFDKIAEKDATGTGIATGGAHKHVLQNFASTDFTFSSIVDVSIDGVSAKKIDFDALLVDNVATLKVSLLIFTERGVISTTDTESFPVAPGSSKFDIYVDDWPFCDGSAHGGINAYASCNSDIGAFLDLDIKMTGSMLGAQCTGHANCDAVSDLDDDTACIAADIVAEVPASCSGAPQCTAVTALDTSTACDAASTPPTCEGGAQCDTVEAGGSFDSSACVAASQASEAATCTGGDNCTAVTDLSTAAACVAANKTDGTTPCDYTAAVAPYTCTYAAAVDCSYQEYVPRVPCVYTPEGGSFTVGDLPSTIIVNGTSRSTGTPLELQPGVATVLSSRVEVDGTWQDVESGYPKSTNCTGDGCYIFTFRFPTGTNLHYDPVVLTDDPTTEEDGGGNNGDDDLTSSAGSVETGFARVALATAASFFATRWTSSV